ncbi:peptide synthetase%2C putative [Mycobacterium tuberculosis]|nr:peptide synthetase%2C putative [Mycobacterium tuberculosis]
MHRVRLSRSQRNLYNGVRQDNNPALYLIGKSYRFRRLELARFLAALHATVLDNPVQLCVLENSGADYPDLVPRLRFGDIVRVGSADEHLQSTWCSGILGSHWCGIRCTPTRTGM